MKSGINAIIYDLGGVLVDWSPHYVFDVNYFENENQRNFFFENVCTADWNEAQDAGYPIDKATEEKVKEFPEWEDAIRDYYGRWKEMLKGPINESVEIFRRIKEETDIRLFALTNWSAETFPVALERFHFLHWFEGRVVSGEEKTRKPFAEFYRILLNRYALEVSKTLFIDDNLRNVKAAEEIGIKSIHYINAADLEKRLIQMGIL